MSQEDKDALESMNESMAFFIEREDYGRAVKEGNQILEKLSEI